MKKLKKLLAGLLGAAMVLTSFGTPAWADETRPTLPTIDTTQTGTLTINKYEGDSTNKPLEGVTFTIWKVADIDQDTSSSSNIGFKYTPVESMKSYLADSDFESTATDSATYTSEIYDKVLAKLNTAIKSETLAGGTSATTKIEEGSDTATAKFTNLELGLYLVQETAAPSQIVNKTANFLVSIPMTNEAGTAWNYDVVANPKNAAVYSGITLLKTGTTINADGTKGTSTSLSGVVFVLQRYDEENSTWSTFTTESNPTGEYTTSSESGKIGMITVDGLAPGQYRFIETSLGDSDTNYGYILNGKPYVFVVNTDKTISVDGVNKGESATINVDNEKPQLEKTVKGADGNYANAADASVGDLVNWKVTASVPSNVGSLNVYKISDTMSAGLTWVSEKSADLVITATDENGTEVTLDKEADYTLTVPADGTKGGTWKIEFTETGKVKLQNNDVTLITTTFNTELNSDATIGVDGNLNDAQLDYSNAIYPEIDPENPNKDKEPGEDHIKDQAVVYSFEIDVTKVDGNNNATKLEGVKFDLYKYSGEEKNPTESILKSNGELIESGLTTDKYGKITKSGLSNGRYYLVETETNKGYNLLKAPVEVVLAVEYTVTKTTDIVKDTNGNVTSTTTVTSKTFTGGDDNKAGTYSVTIENRKGFELPKTGDIGTALFLIIGIGGMLMAVYIMLKGRKRA